MRLLLAIALAVLPTSRFGKAGTQGTGATVPATPSIDGAVLTADSGASGTTPFGPGTVTVAQNRLVVVGVATEQNATSPTITVRWTGGTPAGATGFTQRVVCSYDDSGWWEYAAIWTAEVTGAGGVSNGIEMLSSSSANFSRATMAVWRVQGYNASSPIGASGKATESPASQAQQASLTTTAANSLLLGKNANYNNVTGSALTNVTADASWSPNQIAYADRYTGAVAGSTSYTVGHNITTIGVRAVVLEIKPQ